MELRNVMIFCLIFLNPNCTDSFHIATRQSRNHRRLCGKKLVDAVNHICKTKVVRVSDRCCFGEACSASGIKLKCKIW